MIGRASGTRGPLVLDRFKLALPLLLADREEVVNPCIGVESICDLLYKYANERVFICKNLPSPRIKMILILSVSC